MIAFVLETKMNSIELPVAITNSLQEKDGYVAFVYGPDLVGKSYAAQRLSRAVSLNKDWNPILTTYNCVPSDVGFELRKHKKWWSDVTQTSGQYGTLRDEVEAAIADRSAIYVLDFAFKSRAEFFAGVQHLAVRVVPESAEELERRLIACGRPERIPQAISDFNELIGQGERSDSPDFRRRS